MLRVEPSFEGEMIALCKQQEHGTLCKQQEHGSLCTLEGEMIAEIDIVLCMSPSALVSAYLEQQVQCVSAGRQGRTYRTRAYYYMRSRVSLLSAVRVHARAVQNVQALVRGEGDAVVMSTAGARRGDPYVNRDLLQGTAGAAILI